MKFDIAAGTRIYMGTPDAPDTVDRTETYDRTEWIKGLNINTAIGQDNVTTLTTDTENFAERFITALNNSTGSFDALYGAPTGANLIYLNNIKNGREHPDGRGKVNVIIDVWGSVEGNLSFEFVFFITQIPLLGELGRAVGGSINFQVDGEVTLGNVPA